MMQSANAAPFRGQRLRLRSELRAQGVVGGVTLWFRIDGPSGSLRFENLQRHPSNGPLSGNSEWTERAIVFDVPDEAASLNYGYFLKGTGRGWARGFTLEPVGESVPVNTPEGWVLDAPRNLDFSNRSAGR